MNNERYSMIRLFETFLEALSRLVDRDDHLFSLKKNSIALSHRLAQHLEEVMFGELPAKEQEGFVVDLAYPLEERSLNPDILIHNRSNRAEERLMGVVCRSRYLTNQELLKLHALKSHLTLAVAFLPDKDYFLIYRSDESTLDYYHFYKEAKHCHLLRRRHISEIDESDRQQLRLAIAPKAGRPR